MFVPRRSLGLLPLPDHRRRLLRPLLYLGVAAVVAGRLLDIGFLWGLGVGLVVSSLAVRLADWNARRRVES